jgi:hypothetical protein
MGDLPHAYFPTPGWSRPVTRRILQWLDEDRMGLVGTDPAVVSREGRDEMNTTGAPALHPVLTGQDRCDRCGAEAKVLALLPAGGELLFCGHHARQHRPRLGEVGAALIPDPEASRLQRAMPPAA